MYKYFALILFLFAEANNLCAQNISTHLPSKIDPSQNYLFYFHGAVVTIKGDNAINDGAPEWGRYEYSNILDSLQKRRFYIVSEIRKEGIDDSVYVQKIIKQIDTLITKGIKPTQILLIGASAGWNIVLRAAAKLKNPSLHFVLMGGCWPDTYKEFSDIELFGHFFSVIEQTDPHGTCAAIFNSRKTMSSFREIMLQSGLSHGFIYKGHSFWIDPVMDWFKINKSFKDF